MAVTGDLVNACAVKHAVTARAVRKWRDAGDPRWKEFVAEQGTGKAASREERKTGRKVMASLELPGIRTQLACIEQECKDLVSRLQPDEEGNKPSLEACAIIHRMLDTKRDTWRKLAKDVPPIEETDGASIPVDAAVKYAVEVRALIDTLPAKIVSILPQESSVETKAKVQDEINAVLRLVAAVKIQ